MRNRSQWTRSRLSSFALFVVVLGIGATTLSLAGATKVLNVWPDEFEISNSEQATLQSPSSISSGVAPGQPVPPFSNVNFHKVLELRPGRRIQDVTYFHAGFGNSAFTVVSLRRVKLGEPTQVLASASSTANTQGPIFADIIPVELSVPVGGLLVEPGYRYFLTANVDNSQAAIFGVKVVYR